MPSKDIDYKKLAEDKIIHQKVYKKVALINALREGNIGKAELLAGRELVQKMSPIDIYNEKQKQAPIVNAIKNIPPTPPFPLKTLGEIVRLNTPQIEAPPDPVDPREPDQQEAQAIGPAEKTVKPVYLYDLDKGIDSEVIEKDNLEMPSVLLPHIIDDTIDVGAHIKKVNRLIKNTQVRKNRAYDSGNNERFIQEKYNENILKKYKETLQSLDKGRDKVKVTGRGLKKIQYGKYMIDKKKLGKGVLSISYPNGKKVNGYPNMEVSEDVKRVLLNNKINKNYDISETEKEFLRKFIGKSEADISKSKEKTLCNMTWERLNVLYGELKAGNTSHVVKNELASIAHNFFKNKMVDKSRYKKILNLI